MKTIQELYNEIMAGPELKAKIIEAAQAGKTEEFLKEHGCEATLEEVGAFLKAKSEEDAQLSIDELDNVAGGQSCTQTSNEITFSICTFGIGCAGLAINSAKKGMTEEACSLIK